MLEYTTVHWHNCASEAWAWQFYCLRLTVEFGGFEGVTGAHAWPIRHELLYTCTYAFINTKTCKYCKI